MKTPLFFATLLMGANSFAQNSYTFSTYTSAYQEIEGVAIPDLNDLDEDTWDDPEFTIPLASNFDILGTSYSSTTQAEFGGLMGFLEDNGDIPHRFGIFNDIIDGDALEGADSSDITYTHWITPEFTITIVQYSNVAFYDEIDSPEPSATNRMNFQLWFHTPSNAFEIHFGSSNITDPELVFYGESGPSILLVAGVDFNLQSLTYGAVLTGNPANPDVSEITGFGTDPPGLNAMPDSGRVYRFEPATNGITENTKTPFKLSPTITSDFLKIEGDIQPRSTYRIFDISGKEILKGTVSNQKRVDVSTISSGLYLFSIDGIKSAVKFIKQ